MSNSTDFAKFAAESLKISFASVSDLNIIHALAITTCYEAYFELDPSSDLADYCAHFYSLEQLTKELEDPNLTFLIVEFEGKAVGYAELREGKIIDCLEGKSAIEVQRIYVLEKMKGKNLGGILMDKCSEIGREKGYEMIWLGVWDKNIAARKFYEKIGMKHVGFTDFSDGKNDFINLVMAKSL